MKDTITESELAKIRKKLAAKGFSSGQSTIKNAMRFALSEVGITVVPDPIPEPEGDVIVVDGRGVRWTRGGDGAWRWCSSPHDWQHVTSFGPVKIYRPEQTNG